MIHMPLKLHLLPVLTVFAFGCSAAVDESTTTADENLIEITETTNVIVNGHQVAAGNIWEREFPCDDGTVATRMSAILSVMDDTTLEEWNLIVAEGDSLHLGDRTYIIHSVIAGDESRGLLTLVEAD